MKSPREIAKEISEGIKSPEHLGKHSIQTLSQEVFSLSNIKPDFRNKKWTSRAEKLREVCSEEMGKIPNAIRKRPYLRLENKLIGLLRGEA